VQLTPPGRLDGESTGRLDYRINARDASLSRGRILIHLTSAEGAVLDIPVVIAITPLKPQLLATPGTLVQGMVRGSQSILAFEVANTGGAPSGDLEVLLPAAPWLSLTSASTMPSIAAGEKRTVTLALTPAIDLPLQKFDGMIVLQGKETRLEVPFQFRSVSDATGGVRVAVNDDYTFHVAGSPKVVGAAVRLRDPYDNSVVVAEGVTDAAGFVTLPDVREGVYLLEAQADKHQTYHGSWTIVAGVTRETEVFVGRETVTYRWNVVPTEIEDHYKITLESTFEVDVPIPVVTIEAPAKLPDLAPGESAQIDVNFVNHGLIAAQDLKLNLPTHPEFTFVALSESLGVLPAKSAISVPVTVTRNGGAPAGRKNAVAAAAAGTGRQAKPQAGGGGDCVVWLGGLYFYECGKDHVYHPVYTGIDVGLNTCYAEALFAGLAYFLGGAGGGGGGGGGGTVVDSPPSVESLSSCDPCTNKRLEAVANCVVSLIPINKWISCGTDTYGCVSGGVSAGLTRGSAYNCFKAVVSCGEAAGRSIPFAEYITIVECAYNYITACDDIPNPKRRTATLLSTGAPDPTEVVKLRLARLQKLVDGMAETFGDDAWLRVKDTVALEAWMNAFLAGIDAAGDGGESITPAERAQLLAMELPSPITAAHVGRFADRWNRTIDYWGRGIFNVGQVPAGQSTDFLAFDRWLALLQAANDAMAVSKAEGFVDLVDGLQQAMADAKASLETGSAGVCARVRIRIEQAAVMTRAAFLGTLEIDNGNPALNLTGVRLNLDIRAEDGTPANDRFGIKGPVLKGLSAVDGTGVVAANGSGSALFTFVPNRTAAPQGPAVYRFGGTLRYIDPDSNQEVVVPLFPSTLTVYPDPFLELTYFQQRDVYGDDPFTDETEPSEPFVLGLRVKNTGRGMAKNFRITSAQPKIIENEKGLLIDFKIIGTQVGDQAVEPSLTANLGNIDPGRSQVAKWLLVSTLQGKFVDYSATFEHVDGLGDPRLSLIDKVEIKELIHAVLADRPGDDSLPDFLVNDIADPNDLPDTVYLSDGSVAPVNLIAGAVADADATTGNPVAVVRASMTSGWNYFSLPDPGAGLRLYRAVRSDGKEMRVGDNVWQTDRSFPSSLAGALREHRLHLFDHDGTGSYTLHYRVDDAIAPGIERVGPVDPVVQTGPVPSVEVVFTEDIDLASFGPEDVVLSRNGGANLVTGAVTVSRTGERTYAIAGLSGVTGEAGNYELAVLGSGIVDFGGNAVTGNASVQWALAGTGPVLAGIQAVVPSPRNLPVPGLDVVFSKAINLATFDYNDLSITRDGGPNLVGPGITITSSGGSTYRVNGLGSVTADPGNYVFAADATGVQDPAGNPGIGQLAVRWTMDTGRPTIAVLEQVATNPRNIVVPSLTVRFSKAIDPATFDANDVGISRDGGPNLVTREVGVTRIDPATYRIDGFTWVCGVEGHYTLSVDATGIRDLAGNAGEGSATASWVMDTTPPAPPGGFSITPDLGASGSDGITSVGNVDFAGVVGEPNLTVHVFDATANADLGDAVVTGGNFHKTLALAEGPHRLRVRAVDPAGNVSPEVFHPVYVDRAAPTATLESVSPDPRDSSVPSLDAAFSEAIDAATFTRDDLVLTRDGGANLVDGLVSIQALGNEVYRIGGLDHLTREGGLYELALGLGGIRDVAGNPGEGRVVQTWRRLGANTAPVLASVPDLIVGANTLLSHAFSANDADIPANRLTFALDAGFPQGASINAASGLFKWTPSRAQAPGVYSITVRVTDDGSPALGDSRTFQVTVTDYAELNVGQAIVAGGEQGAVPVEFFASAPAADVEFDLDVPPGRVGGLTIAALVPEVGSATILKQGDTRYHVKVTARAGSAFQARAEIVELGCTATGDGHSAFVPLVPGGLAVRKTDGTPISTVFARSGRIVLIQAEPLVEMVRDTGSPRRLMLYGKLGVGYQLQSSLEFGLPIPWNDESRVTMTERSRRVDLAPPAGGTIFYRARQLP